MKELLTQFYKDYLKWIEDGAPYDANAVFDRHVGLCTNLCYWSSHRQLYGDASWQLYEALKQQFIAIGLDHEYPFCAADGGNAYYAEAASGTMHLNPNRIAWVQKHALEGV